MYSFAATLYTLLEGIRPFAAPDGAKQSVGDLARRIMLDEPPRVRRDDVPRSLAAVLVGAMGKRPDDRPGSAGELGVALQRVQAELGLAVTALPVATSMAPPAPAAAATAGTTAQKIAHDEDQGHTVTVARGAPPAPPAPVPPAPEASNRRIVFGTVAGVACLLLVAGALLLFGGDGEGDGDDPVGTGPATTQLLAFDPPAPQGVVVAAGDPGQVVVSWQPVGQPGDGTEYQVRPQTGDASPRNTTELQLAFEIAQGERPCYTVLTITPDGRISDPSDLACL